MLIAALVIGGMATLFGALLGYASVHYKVEGDPITDKIDQILPQTQCGQCGYPGCRPYAEAISNEGAAINLCPPGGETVMVSLADLLDREPVALEQEERPPSLALIDEKTCIGCTLCIQACPVDAILGAAKLMHTVIATECTGCELCLAPCPVDCITMEPIPTDITDWSWPDPDMFKVAA
ncbi:MAG: electron transport complex subunit RsxB [Thiotrichales bacterium]|jgi:electron transport complex protein RnfB|nr:electron transport complex subunit RsxB [Thiotrichales bacterium]MBT3613487.1 electron transport complex subunit RsxB [Thiotrichales bacterium]MBT3753044.1 electron transport complex subunit RsxB [Thiotrichales bacterium]MBT3837327.1 electron transport complex subunit RsxB [Thiotrichales bacterium]MBT4151649.1 electron transport complex subunit RsxB [Thiotrichales bacterium]